MKKPDLDVSDIELRAWTKKKLAGYQETPRAGVPRGEELPIPRHKYHAALLMLLYGTKTYPDLTAIAKETGATYALIGKWRNERKFKSLIRDLAEEFLSKWFQFFFWLSEEIDAKESKKEKAEFEDMLERAFDLCQLTWGEPLQNAFSQKATAHAEKGEQPLLGQIRMLQLMSIWTRPSLSTLSAKKRNSIIDLSKQMYQAVFDRVKVLAAQAVRDSNKEAATQLIESLHSAAVDMADSYWELARSQAVGEKSDG